MPFLKSSKLFVINLPEIVNDSAGSNQRSKSMAARNGVLGSGSELGPSSVSAAVLNISRNLLDTFASKYLDVKS